MIPEMRMLLWKDYRLSRMCLIAGIIFIIIPYMFLLDPYLRGYVFNNAWQFSTMLSQLIIALLAGNIIVCERADRSSAFLAFQGVSRKKIISSKLIICTIVFISICAISYVLSLWLKLFIFTRSDLEDIREVQYYSYYIVGFCIFGSCWLLSCLLPSTISAIVFGLLAPFFNACILIAIHYYFNWLSPFEFAYWFLALDIAVGLISLVAGTWYFLKSKES